MRQPHLAMITTLLVLTGCASPPEFIPSGQVERASSLPESLRLCHEYRMPDPAARPVALRPYVDCLDRAAARAGTRSRAFDLFHRELALRYRTLSEAEWTPRLGAELRVAIQAALRALWQRDARIGTMNGDRSFTRLEQELLLRHFPWTAETLGVNQWRPSRQAQFDPQLENLKASLSALWAEDVHGALPAGNLVRGRTLCSDLRKLQGEVTYLDALWRDVDDLSRLPEGAAVLPRVSARYRRHRDEAVRRLLALRPGLRAAREAGDFSPAQCRSPDA
jgi:hypothetical protein